MYFSALMLRIRHYCGELLSVNDMMHAKMKDLIECYLPRHTGCAKTNYIMKALNPSFSPLARLL